MPLFGKNTRNDHTKTAYKPQVWVKSKHIHANKNHKKQPKMTEKSVDQSLQVTDLRDQEPSDKNQEDFSWMKRTATVLIQLLKQITSICKFLTSFVNFIIGFP